MGNTITFSKIRPTDAGLYLVRNNGFNPARIYVIEIFTHTKYGLVNNRLNFMVSSYSDNHEFARLEINEQL